MDKIKNPGAFLKGGYKGPNAKQIYPGGKVAASAPDKGNFALNTGQQAGKSGATTQSKTSEQARDNATVVKALQTLNVHYK